MSDPNLYEIRIEGLLPEHWSEWFEGLEIRHDSDHKTVIRGEFVDQAALFGVLTKVQSLNLKLVSVNRIGYKSLSDTGADIQTRSL